MFGDISSSFIQNCDETVLYYTAIPYGINVEHGKRAIPVISYRNLCVI